ncbi:hypothetical protein C452_15275 [Haloferax volcanii JCM 10717]|uniref:Uncharacterized protein n=1 Tax=Haloferax volcanii JCM 10717 TaxID=1227458 RepID=M0HWN4_HALVO|nr:hypothetical protein C452_15275 [Haloferax alexandrinus JCM 10717]
MLIERIPSNTDFSSTYDWETILLLNSLKQTEIPSESEKGPIVSPGSFLLEHLVLGIKRNNLPLLPTIRRLTSDISKTIEQSIREKSQGRSSDIQACPLPIILRMIHPNPLFIRERYDNNLIIVLQAVERILKTSILLLMGLPSSRKSNRISITGLQLIRLPFTLLTQRQL